MPARRLPPAWFVSDTLPAGVVNAIAASSRGPCLIAGNVITCNVGTLRPGESVFVAVNGQVDSSFSGVLINTAACKSAAGSSGCEFHRNDDRICSRRLGLVKLATATVNAGDRITYTWWRSTTDLDGPECHDRGCAASRRERGRAGGCTPAGQSVTCAVGALAPGARVTYTLVVTARQRLAPGTSLENRATVTSTTADPDSLNNEATADTSILASALLRIARQRRRRQ